jgi:hypothetical protein
MPTHPHQVSIEPNQLCCQCPASVAGHGQAPEQDPVGSATLGGFITLTDDVDDIVAYLKLLGPNR